MGLQPQDLEADRIATTARIQGLWLELVREIEAGIIRGAVNEEMTAQHIVTASKEGDDWSVAILLATAPVPRWQVHRALAQAAARFGYVDDRHRPNGADDGASD